VICEPCLPSMVDLALLCAARGRRLTETRRNVLEALYHSGRPVTAYDLITILQGRLQRKLSPPSVYRALEFLVETGLATRIESRNAYVLCAHPDHPHDCVLFVCDRCDVSVEVENPALERLIAADATHLGFKISRQVVELQGLCALCADTPAA